MTLKRRSDYALEYQISKSLHDKVRPYVDFYFNLYKSGKMEYEEALMYADSAVKFPYIFKDVTKADLIAWTFTGYQSSRSSDEQSDKLWK